MNNIPSFKTIFKNYFKQSIFGSFYLTLIYSLLLFLIFYQRFSNEFTSNDFFQWNEIITLVIVVIVFFIWNYVVCLMGIYLLFTSYLISVRYVRFLFVITGIVFVLSFFHFFPVPEIDKKFSLISNLLIRFLQGLIFISLGTVFYSLIQGLTLFVIGKEKVSND